MPIYQYEIGTTAENMVNVETLLASGDKTTPPQGMAVEPYSVYRRAVSGMEYGDGYPQTTWRFNYLSPAMLDTLMGYLSTAQSGRVYIKTRLSDGTYSTYTAIMHRPKIRSEMSWEGYWRDVSIRFTRMEAVA